MLLVGIGRVELNVLNLNEGPVLRVCRSDVQRGVRMIRALLSNVHHQHLLNILPPDWGWAWFRFITQHPTQQVLNELRVNYVRPSAGAEDAP